MARSKAPTPDKRVDVERDDPESGHPRAVVPGARSEDAAAHTDDPDELDAEPTRVDGPDLAALDREAAALFDDGVITDRHLLAGPEDLDDGTGEAGAEGANSRRAGEEDAGARGEDDTLADAQPARGDDEQEREDEGTAAPPERSLRAVLGAGGAVLRVVGEGTEAGWRAVRRGLGRPRALLRGMSAGPVLMVGLFAIELAVGARLQMMGVHDEDLQKTLLGRFGRVLVVQQVQVLGVYLAVGIVVGGAGALALSLWERTLRRRGTGLLRWVGVFGFTALVEAWRLGVTVIRYPQLFAEALYDKGGWRRDLQIALTDRVPQALLVWGGWALLLAFVLGPALAPRGRRWLRQVARALPTRLRRARRPVVVAGAVGGLTLALAVPLMLHRNTARAGEPGAGSSRPPNVLILAVDSLRADRVGPGHRDVAPHLARLAEKSVLFDAAHVTIPRTFPSWATILSGRWPAHHGIRHMFPPARERAAVGTLLPSVLAARGLQTAVVSDFSGEIFSRLGAGFADRDVPPFDMRVVLAQAGFNLHPMIAPYVASRLGHRLFPALAAAPENADPDRLADQVIDAIDRTSRRGPFFVTAFFSTPHFPYAAPDPYYRRFTDRGYRGRFRYHKPVAALGNQDGELSDEDRIQIRGLYDGAVASVDDAIGRVLGALAERGLDKDTIVVILADHGENLYEPGNGMGHGEHLHGDMTLHIPLVLYDPVHRFPAHRVPGIVRDVDVAPTLAALTGSDMPGTDGVDLGPLLRGEATTLDLAAYAETELWLVPEGPGFRPDERLPYPPLPALVTLAADDDIVIDPALRDVTIAAKHRAVRTDRWKLIYRPTRDGVRWSLYDVKADGDEQRDVAPREPEVLALLQEKLFRWMMIDGSTVEAGFVVPPTDGEGTP